jgi:hypothetical protein
LSDKNVIVNFHNSVEIWFFSVQRKENRVRTFVYVFMQNMIWVESCTFFKGYSINDVTVEWTFAIQKINCSQTWVNDQLRKTTPCLQRPPFCDPIFNFYNLKLLLNKRPPINNDRLLTTTAYQQRPAINNDHLSITTTYQ